MSASAILDRLRASADNLTHTLRRSRAELHVVRSATAMLTQRITLRLGGVEHSLLGYLRLARRVVRVLLQDGPRAPHIATTLATQASEYERWVALHDTVTEAALARLSARVELLYEPPAISLLTPVHDPEVVWLREAIDSVRSQVYPNWQLCLADDASTRQDIHELLRSAAASDPRIRVVFRSHNGHISAASNSALALATGSHLALLDHDDVLAPDALLCVAEAVARTPRAGIIYSDEDKIDIHGYRFDPYFKPDWNRDLFYSHNMISHLGTYRADLVRAIGGFREGFEGSQDYDLALRVLELIDDRDIVHVPHVLYHWRATPGSTAASVDEKGYAVIAALRAMQEHFQRRGLPVQVLPCGPRGQQLRVRYPIPGPMPLVSIVIPTRDRVDLLRTSITSVLATNRANPIEIIIVDNQSREPATRHYFAELGSEPRVRIVPFDAPFNFSAACNLGVKHSRGEVVVLLNNDIEAITPDWLIELTSHALRPEVGAVGAMLYYPDDTIQHAGVVMGIGGVAGHVYRREPRGTLGRAALLQSYSVVTAACLAIRRSVYDEVNGLDETFAVAFNDVDFCLRVRARGYRNVWTPFAELYHFESATRGSDETPEQRPRFLREVALMQERWGAQMLDDPAYNPNFSLQSETFGLAFPPRRPRF